MTISIGMIGLTPKSYLKWASWGYVPDDYRFGDLYRLANLPQFKEEQTKCISPSINEKKKIALYVIGDSFLEKERINGNDFAVQQYHYVHKNHVEQIQLDTTLENVLLIESVERHTREYLDKEISNYEVLTTQNTVKPITQKKEISILERLQRINARIEERFHFGQIDQRFENILFNFDPILKIKEWKATINYNLFKRTTGNASVSGDGKHLFYQLDTDTTKVQNSSFSYLPENEIDSMVFYLNKSAEKYKKLGFKSIYFCIIPNKASILEPNRGNYNHLIERIQENKQLKVSYFDIYSIFKKSPKNVYAISDSHWNCEGRELWLAMVNRELVHNP